MPDLSLADVLLHLDKARHAMRALVEGSRVLPGLSVEIDLVFDRAERDLRKFSQQIQEVLDRRNLARNNPPAISARGKQEK